MVRRKKRASSKAATRPVASGRLAHDGLQAAVLHRQLGQAPVEVAGLRLQLAVAPQHEADDPPLGVQQGRPRPAARSGASRARPRSGRRPGHRRRPPPGRPPRPRPGPPGRGPGSGPRPPGAGSPGRRWPARTSSPPPRGSNAGGSERSEVAQVTRRVSPAAPPRRRPPGRCTRTASATLTASRAGAPGGHRRLGRARRRPGPPLGASVSGQRGVLTAGSRWPPPSRRLDFLAGLPAGARRPGDRAPSSAARASPRPRGASSAAPGGRSSSATR